MSKGIDAFLDSLHNQVRKLILCGISASVYNTFYDACFSPINELGDSSYMIGEVESTNIRDKMSNLVMSPLYDDIKKQISNPIDQIGINLDKQMYKQRMTRSSDTVAYDIEQQVQDIMRQIGGRWRSIADGGISSSITEYIKEQIECDS